MGCGSSVSQKQLSEELKKSEAELLEERRRIQEKDAQIASVRDCLQEQMQGSEEAAALQAESLRSVQDLRAELEARRAEHKRELEGQRDSILEEHRTELKTMLQDRDAAARAVDEHAESQPDARSRRAAAERSHEALVERLRELANGEAQRHRAEAEAAERELRQLRDELRPLRTEHEQAAEALQHARHLLRAEMMERTSTTSKATALERSLTEAQEEHVRSEQRYTDLAQHLRAQMRDLQTELRLRTEELWQRNGALQQRDQELLDVNCQLADLQGLFDEVNHQLQSECARIEKLQETVSLCAKQSQELDQLQAMLEDSHRMLAQVRDALEQERAERVKTAGQLEHEQQRTQLLLEVLKHFKEKLQGLTPQMLLSRLNGVDAKALFASTPGATVFNPVQVSGSPSLRSRALSPCPPMPRPGGLREGVKLPAMYVGSPRHAMSDGAASTIAPDNCSFPAWPTGASMVAPSAASIRSPSPASRLTPSPGMVRALPTRGVPVRIVRAVATPTKAEPIVRSSSEAALKPASYAPTGAVLGGM